MSTQSTKTEPSTLPDDLRESDYTITTTTGRTLGWMRARHWGDAASQISVWWADGDEWVPTGRQVADYRHSSTDAALDLFDDEIPEGVEIVVK